MRSRRDILRLAAHVTTAASLGMPFAEGRARAAPARRDGPRYFLSIFLSGGIDPIYTTDPKVRADVEPWVDVPYGRDAIVDAGAVQLGPHFAPLGPVVSRLAIVNGVQLRTANHNTGAEQFLRVRTGTRPEMPSLLQLLGSTATGRPWAAWTGSSEARSSLASSGMGHARICGAGGACCATGRRPCRGGSAPERQVTAGSLDESAELFERVAGLAPPRIERWATDEAGQQVAVSLQRILWLFENDLTRGFELNLGGVEQPWDTHTFNAERQKSASAPVAMVARFLGELDRRRTKRGPLSAQTLVVMGSEIGRFPALNTAHGKDHFPEAPFVLYGAGLSAGGGKGAVYGRTGKNLAATPVSLRTGQPASINGHVVLLDDLGATLLYLGGVSDPSVYGYDGRVLDFLVNA